MENIEFSKKIIYPRKVLCLKFQDRFLLFSKKLFCAFFCRISSNDIISKGSDLKKNSISAHFKD